MEKLRIKSSLFVSLLCLAFITQIWLIVFMRSMPDYPSSRFHLFLVMAALYAILLFFRIYDARCEDRATIYDLAVWPPLFFIATFTPYFNTGIKGMAVALPICFFVGLRWINRP